MLMRRVRAVMLCLLMMMPVGSVLVSVASAEAGPFWHHRPIGGKGEGNKIEPSAPENFRGTGGEQKLAGFIGGQLVEINSPSVQVKGAIFNATLQGQVKLELIYNQPRLIKPVLTNCNVTVGTRNIAIVKAHLMWKWNETEAQLREQPQRAQRSVIAFTPIELPLQNPAPKNPIELNKAGIGNFTTITLAGSGCGLLAGTFNVGGSEVANLKGQLEEFNRKLDLYTTFGGRFLQHYWNGTAFLGAELGLVLAGGSADLVGQTKIESEQQEIAVFEK